LIQSTSQKQTDIIKKYINKIISKHTSKATNPNTLLSQDSQKNLFNSNVYKRNNWSDTK